MPARVVLVHDDPEFVGACVAILREASYDTVAFTDPMAALNALDAAQMVELLITRLVYPPGKPNGLSLARMTKSKRPSVRVLLMTHSENSQHIGEEWGEWLLLPTTPTVLLEAVNRVFGQPAKNSN